MTGHSLLLLPAAMTLADSIQSPDVGTGHRTQEHDMAHAVTGQVRRGTGEETPWPPPAKIKIKYKCFIYNNMISLWYHVYSWDFSPSF